MVGLEFYLYEDELWCKTNDGENFIVDESKKDLIRYILEQIRNYYPEAYSSLCNIYSKSALNNEYYQYLMVRRFCKCNFCKLDTTSMDIDPKSKFNFEKVECPLRGECPYESIVCCPKFDSNLSQAELRTMKLLYKGLSVGDAEKELFLSPNTIRQHMKSVYVKLGVHKISEFIKYANDRNMFN